MKISTKFLSIFLAALTLTASMAVSSVSAVNVEKTSIKAYNSSKGVKITWKKTKTAKKYIIMRKISGEKKYKKIKSFSSYKPSGYIDTNAKEGKTYSYVVKTKKGNSSAISKAKKVLRLKAPKSVKVKYSELSTMLNWKKATGTEKYKIYRATVSDTNIGSYKKIGSTKKEIYSDYTVKSGNTYKYKIKSVNNDFESAYSKTVTFTYIEAPIAGASANSKHDRINVHWYPVRGGEKYCLYRAVNSEKEFKKVATFKKSEAVYKDDYNYKFFKYIDTDVKKGSTYFYYVVAFNGSAKSNYYTSGEVIF